MSAPPMDQAQYQQVFKWLLLLLSRDWLFILLCCWLWSCGSFSQNQILKERKNVFSKSCPRYKSCKAAMGFWEISTTPTQNSQILTNFYFFNLFGLNKTLIIEYLCGMSLISCLNDEWMLHVICQAELLAIAKDDTLIRVHWAPISKLAGLH